MIIVLNGPLGIGKSTLAEALMESIDACAVLEGDSVLALNPAPANVMAYLHATLALLIQHHRSRGYRHFVIEHLWRSAGELRDLRSQLEAVAPGDALHCFLLTLPLAENLERIASRQTGRVSDERDFELRTMSEERVLLEGRTELGEPLDVSAAPSVVARTVRQRLGLQGT